MTAGVVTEVPHDRSCAWCRGPIPASKRRDAVCCSVRCRQARHRFGVAVGAGGVADGQPRRLAYADPPYPKNAQRYYADHPDYAGEVDHAALIGQLVDKYDGWALSTSARALPDVLRHCPEGVRVAAWVRGERPTRSNAPLNAWEPVIYLPARALDASSPGRRDASAIAALRLSDDPSSMPTRRVNTAERDASRGSARRIDALVYPARPRRTDPQRVVGSKPATFCRWVFDLLGAMPHDELVDVYPGSGGVSRAWDVFCRTESA